MIITGYTFIQGPDSKNQYLNVKTCPLRKVLYKSYHKRQIKTWVYNVFSFVTEIIEEMDCC